MPTIQIRVTDVQKDIIAHNASLLGVDPSKYGRAVMLNPGIDLNGKVLQEIAANMCQHALLVNQLPPSSIRDDLTQWEGEIWQLLK
ncbi:MAG: hypothetical protein HDT16_10990 [Oscillibacter sp.]|nr:hypothetical protein [Oscillibacter sp.]